MKIGPSPSFDIEPFERPNEDLEVLYGLPREVKFCKKCNMSNQQPMSSNEYSHSKESKKRPWSLTRMEYVMLAISIG